MRWANFALRTGTVLGGLALFAALVFFLPHQHHLAFNVGVTAAAVLGGLEMEAMLLKRGTPAFRCAALAGGLLPAVTYLEVQGLVGSGWAVAAAVALGLLLGLLPTLWVGPSRAQELSASLPRAASTLLVLLYPAALLSFVVRLTGLPRPALTLALFFCLVFFNDILAYLVGTFLGAGTRLNYPVSPNKSALGFAGGLLGSVGVALGFRAAVPQVLPIGYGWVALFGAFMGALVICGDLVESAFKRSAGVKDSGRIVPGRGGVLDSIDSWLLGAPAFYAVMQSLSWWQTGMRGTLIP
jgi:phosphatidate cytidylyltransferase